MYGNGMTGSWRRPVGLLAAFLLLASCGGGGAGTGIFGSNNARFGYALNAGDNTLSVYLIDAGSGQWRPHGYVRTGSGPAAVVTNLSGQFVYVANKTAATLSAYKLNTASGRLVEVAGSAYPVVGTDPSALAVEASGKFLYAANSGTGDIVAFSIDATSGALMQIDADPVAVGVNTMLTGGTAPASLVIDPTGKFLYVANSGSSKLSAFSINATTGSLSAIASPYTTGTTPVDAAIDATGKYLYVANSGSGSISGFSINTTTGELTELTGSPFTAGTAGSGTQSVRLHPSGKFAYVGNYTTNELVVFSVDTTTGIFGTSSPFATEPGPRSVRVDPSGRFLFHISETSRYTVTYSINSTTGALSAKQIARTRVQPVALTYTKGTGLSVRTRNAYVANFDDGTVGYYNVDATSGALLPQTAVSISPAQPKAVVTDPYGRFAYTANYVDNNVSGYTIGSTGALTSVGAVIAAGTDPAAAAVDPSGRFLYVVNRNVGSLNGSVSGYSIAPTTGVLSSLGAEVTVGVEPCAISIDPTGQYLYVVNCDPTNPVSGSVAAFAVDVATGGLTPVAGSPFAAGLQPTGVAGDPSGRFLYVTNSNTASLTGSVSIYAITAGTGALSAPGNAATGDTPASIAIDPKARFAYVANSLGGTAGSYTLNSGTGALTPVSAPATMLQPVWVSADPSGRFVYTVDTGDAIISLFSVNSGTGVLTRQSGASTGSGPSCLALTTSIQ